MILLANLTLVKKITLLTTIGLVVVIGTFSFLSIRAVNQATETLLQDRLTTAHLVADYLDETLGRALTELERTAQLVEIEGESDNLESRVEALQEAYRRLSIYSQGIYLVNKQGQILWSKPEVHSVLISNVFSYPNIGQIIEREETSISGLAQESVTNTPVVLLTSPTSERRQGSKGVLIVAIDLAKSSVGGFVQPIRLGETGYIEIIDQNGLVVARTDPGPKLAPFEKSDHSGRFAALITAGEPVRGVCHTCHELEQKVKSRDVLAFVPLASAQWGVVVRQAEEEALAPARELRQNLLIFGVILVTITLLLVAIAARDIVGRIRRLTTASQRITEGDLISPVTTLGKDEIGLLAHTFDNMRAKLKASHGELKQLYRDARHKEKIRRELLHELLSLQEEERKRIARELHDETSQAVTSISANLEAALSMLPANVQKAKAIIRKTQKQSINILEEINRLIYELRPAVLDDLGLVPAIRWLAETNLEEAGVLVNFKTAGRMKRLGIKLETVLFRVIQEVVQNIAKHAHAKNVNINLNIKKTAIKVQVTDDGRGFDVKEAMITKDRPRGLGLLGMKERVELVGGRLDIRSGSGGGTEINIEIPLNQEVSNG